MANLNRIDELCRRAELLKLGFHEYTVPESIFAEVEEKLEIILPLDFRNITKRYNYYWMPAFVFAEFVKIIKQDGSSKIRIIEYNLNYRNYYNDLKNVLVLGEESDISYILMFTQNSPNKPTPIIECSYDDIENFSKTGKFTHPINKWDSFTDFFEFLINHEEQYKKEREEEEITKENQMQQRKKSIWQRLFNK